MTNPIRGLRAVLVPLALCLSAPDGTSQQTQTERSKLISPDPEPVDRFGEIGDISADFMIVGERLDGSAELAFDPNAAAVQDGAESTPAPIEQLLAWSRELRPPYSMNAIVEVTRLDESTATSVAEVRATLDGWIRSLEDPAGEIDFDDALRSYLGWIGPMALSSGKMLRISRVHHRADGQRILEVREEEHGFVSARLLARGWALDYSLARLRIEEEAPILRRSLFDLERLFYPLGIDEAGRSWYSDSRWAQHQRASGSWWLSRLEEEGSPGTLVMTGRAARPIPDCILKKTDENGTDVYVLALFRGVWIERKGLPSSFVSEVLVFDTLALGGGTVQLKRILVGDVSFGDQADIRLPLALQGLERMQDARWGPPTDTYGPDVASWPVDIRDLIRVDD